MRKVFTVVVTVVAAGALWLATATPVVFAGIRKVDRVPDFVQVVDERGRRASIQRYRRKVVVLTIGASWCDTCERELPALEKLASAYARRKANVVFVAVNVDNEI